VLLLFFSGRKHKIEKLLKKCLVNVRKKYIHCIINDSSFYLNIKVISIKL